MRLHARLIGLSLVASACARPHALATAAAASTLAVGTVHEDAFFSEALGVSKHLAIYLPPSYARDPNRRFPVAYYLHGLGGSETDWLSRAGIDRVADSLIASGAPEMIVVMPDGDDGWYTTWVDQLEYKTCADTVRGEAASRYCVAHQRYDDYIARDVVHYVDATYRTHADRGHRMIGGLSMGGYGAITLALRHPELFAVAVSHSGVLSPRYFGPHPFSAPPRYASSPEELRTIGGAFAARYVRYWGLDSTRWRAADPALIAADARGSAPALYFDCGKDDPFIDQNRALDWELTRLGVPHTFVERNGTHNWRYWSSWIGVGMAWGVQHLSG